MAPNCRACAPCRDMPAQGGAGARRQPCVRRGCLALLSLATLPTGSLGWTGPAGAVALRAQLGRTFSSNVDGDGAGRTMSPMSAQQPAPLPRWSALRRAATASNDCQPAPMPHGAADIEMPVLRLRALDGDPLSGAANWALPCPVAAAPLQATSVRTGLGLGLRAASRLVPQTMGRRPTEPTAQQPRQSFGADLDLLPGRDEELQSRRERMREVMRAGYAPTTVKKDLGHFRACEAICRDLGTSPWRLNVAANLGLDVAGHQNEVELLLHVLIASHKSMVPRNSRTKAVADPRSAVKRLQGWARHHFIETGVRMVEMKSVTLACRGLMREYIDEYGLEGLIPDRKNPLTNELIDGMLSTPDGTKVGHLVVEWDSYYWTSLYALFCVLAESGERKDEVAKANAATPFRKGRFTFASLSFKIGGVILDRWPSRAELDSMAPGDGILLAHGVSKNDPVGQWFAATPTFLPWRTAGRCACRALARLISHPEAAVLGGRLDTTPLFGPKCGGEFTHAQVDKAFFLLLEVGGKVPRALLSNYSVHSFRIFLCCALLNANCSHTIIKRILRWRGDASLIVYGRTDDEIWGRWLDRSLAAHVDSTMVGRLPQVDPTPEQRAAFLSIARSLLNVNAANAGTDAQHPDGL